MSENGATRLLTAEQLASGSVTLSPQSVEAIARRVAELIAAADSPAPSSADLVSPAELARHLGRKPRWVYDHAAELGAIRVGSGVRPRLLFDFDAVRARLAAEAGTSDRVRPAKRRPRRRKRDAAPALLPVRGGG